MPIIARAWYRVGMDLTGPLIPSQGYQYILTMVDHFTKWVETRPLKSKTTSEVSRGIFSIYCSKGAPVQIISDNGGEFRSQLMEYLHEECNCRLIFTAPYSPQTNGLTESYHKVIKTCLIKSLSGQQDRWVENLEHITFSLNIRSRNQSKGYSAFELMDSFRKARLPNEATDIFEKEVLGCEENETDDCWGDDAKLLEFNTKVNEIKEVLYENASINLLKSKIKMKKQHDKRLNPVVRTDYKLTDRVLVVNHRRKKNQLQIRWLGPFPITKVNQNIIVVEKDGKPLRFKHSQVSLC